MTREEAKRRGRMLMIAGAYPTLGSEAESLADEILTALSAVEETAALAAPAPQEKVTKPSVEVTLTAGAWRSLVAGLDEEGAEHATPITVCYDAKNNQGIYCYAEYPDDGARTIDPAPPASEESKP